jgi:hypothetical protein
MKDFVAACQQQAVDGATWFIPASRWFIKVRNLTFRMMPYLPWRNLIRDMSLKVGNAIEFTTYEDRPLRPAGPRP